MPDNAFHSGFVALVGRPNVGKSTLLNKLVGKKVSITSKKPQTTRQRILGIKTTEQHQIIYVDTPGIHRHRGTTLNKWMNRAALSTFTDVDLILFIVEAGQWTEEDEFILEQLPREQIPVFLIINKIDRIKDKEQLLPFIGLVSAKMNFERVIPISAKNNDGLLELERETLPHISFDGQFYPAEQITDKGDSFVSAEIVREKLFRLLEKEVPYQLSVVVDKIVADKKLHKVFATIWVERKGQKAIILGRKGEKIKKISTQAREELEQHFGTKVYLDLWVKVKEGWSDSEQMLKQFGYYDES